ncbi:DUF1173 domain-containing protein [Mesorhizobium sp. A623]
MRQFRITGELHESDAPDLQAALRSAYERRERPLCLCREPGLPMYIARMGDQFLIKRMPFTGAEHDPACESFEPPYELSGLGALMGSAIQLDPATGMAALKLEFSLSKRGSRASPLGTGNGVADSVSGEARKMTLRGLLHYLWHESGMTKWTSAWAGKRHWWNLQWHLTEAAKQMAVKSAPLSDILYIPEQFRSQNKQAIEQRRAEALARALPPKSGPRPLMVLVGEVKEFVPARTGSNLVVKHMPGFPFILDEGMYRRLQARFDSEIALWSADETSHLIAIATFGMNAAGLAIIEEIALMVVSENWIPYESAYEKRLVDALAKVRQQSTKGLRYNLPADQPMATAMFLQRQPRPVALYIVPPTADEKFEAALGELIPTRPEIDAWVWRVADGEMTPLPT